MLIPVILDRLHESNRPRVGPIALPVPAVPQRACQATRKRSVSLTQ